MKAKDCLLRLWKVEHKYDNPDAGVHQSHKSIIKTLQRM